MDNCDVCRNALAAKIWEIWETANAAVIFDLNWDGIERKAILEAWFKAQQIRSGPPTTAERRWHRSSGMCHAVVCLPRPRCHSLFTAESSLQSIFFAPTPLPPQPPPTARHQPTGVIFQGPAKNPWNPGIRIYSLPPPWGWIVKMMECVNQLLDALRHLRNVHCVDKKQTNIDLRIMFRKMNFTWQLGFCWLAFSIRIVIFGSSRLSKTDTDRTEKVPELGW